MDAARRTGWQASTGIQRSGEEAYVHARSGRPCRRCGDTVRVAMTGAAPRQRTLFSCPTCQGGLAPTDDGRPQRRWAAAGGAPEGYAAEAETVSDIACPTGSDDRRGEGLDALDALAHQLEHLGQAQPRGRCTPRRAARRRPPSCRARAH